MIKKMISALLCLCLMGTMAGAFDKTKDLEAALEKTGAWLIASEGGETLSPGNEWAIIGLARSGLPLPASLFAGYYDALTALLAEQKGRLNENRYTDYARTVLALTAIGRDPMDTDGWDLAAPLRNYDRVTRQGLNGAVFALLALDCGSYPGLEVRQRYLSYILDAQLEDGGFALTGTKADPDITAMTLQALAPYRGEEEVAAAVSSAVDCLSLIQKENGGYEFMNSENAEGCAQVIIALCTLGLDPEGEAFVKDGGGVVDALMSYAHEDGFLHEAGGSRINEMATSQAFLALVAMDRLSDGKSPLYQMSDVTAGGEAVGLAGRHGDIRPVAVSDPDKTFSDIAGHPARQSIEALARRGILTGREEDVFAPDESMKRSEFTALIIRALGLEAGGKAAFADVPADAWYAGYVAAAVDYGIVTGRTPVSFDPDGQITRQEAAVMVARAAALCGVKSEPTDAEAREILARLEDGSPWAPWAAQSLALCYDTGILSGKAVRPLEDATRSEIAQMTANLLDIARLLTK